MNSRIPPVKRGDFYFPTKDGKMYLQNNNTNVRISLPSKGRLAENAMTFMADCGLRVYQPNPRQYEASIPSLPGVTVLFQRPADIVGSVRDGSVDLGITGMDVVEERRGDNGDVMVLHEALGFGECMLSLAVPEAWADVYSAADLAAKTAKMEKTLRVATKYPVLTERFLKKLGITANLIPAEGTLETAPTIGYADMICDIVSSGQTLRDNRLRPLNDGVIMRSQAALIANSQSLRRSEQTLEVAKTLLEFFEAHLRASGDLAIFANMRGDSPEAIAARIFNECSIAGLQGPTISRIVVKEDAQNWYAVNIIVAREIILRTIRELRAIGGSGVVVMPITYIFDEEPLRIKTMMQSLKADNEKEGA
jgi:ATP phosphoribosyltransferase